MDFTLVNGTAVHFRTFERSDAAALNKLHSTLYTSERDEDYFVEASSSGHCVVAIAGDDLIAFRFQRRMAPGVLGEGEMLVEERYRRQGIGSALLRFFEATMSAPWHLSIVFNSNGYGTSRSKPEATAFWVAHGYRLVASTAETRVLIKQFDRPASP